MCLCILKLILIKKLDCYKILSKKKKNYKFKEFCKNRKVVAKNCAQFLQGILLVFDFGINNLE